MQLKVHTIKRKKKDFNENYLQHKVINNTKKHGMFSFHF